MRFDNAPILFAKEFCAGRRCPSCDRVIVLGPVATKNRHRYHLYRCICGQLVRVAPTATQPTPENT